jgi:hypothetical protein
MKVKRERGFLDFFWFRKELNESRVRDRGIERRIVIIVSVSALV